MEKLMCHLHRNEIGLGQERLEVFIIVLDFNALKTFDKAGELRPCASVSSLEAPLVATNLQNGLIHSNDVLKRRSGLLETLGYAMHIGHHFQEVVL
jgi:hypothetical protein